MTVTQCKMQSSFIFSISHCTEVHQNILVFCLDLGGRTMFLCMETVLIAARYDKICHHSTFDGGCAIILDVEITDKLFLVVFFSVYRKLDNSTVIQWRTMPSSSLWSFGWCQFSFPGMFKLPGFPQDRCRRCGCSH